MSQNSLGDIKLFEYKGKKITVEKSRLSRDSTIEDVVRENIRLNELVQSLADEFQKFQKHYNDDNVFKTNKFKPAIERTTKASGDTIINTITGDGSSGGGGSVSTSDITTVSVSLTGGVAAPQVFSAPATLVSVPIGYATIDGMLSAEILAPTSLTVVGFTITSLQNCVCIYSYKLL